MTIRTDKLESELGLYEGQKQLVYIKWEAHRQLAETIHKQIEKILNKLSISWKDLGGIAIYKGPGSFTGLRIGMAVANALAYGLEIPVVATAGQQWREKGIKKLLAGQTDHIALPEYAAPAATTQPKQ